MLHICVYHASLSFHVLLGIYIVSVSWIFMNNVSVNMNTTFTSSIPLLMGTGHFQDLAIRSCAAINMHGTDHCDMMSLTLWGTYMLEEQLSQMEFLFSFLRNLISTVVVLVYIATNNA